MYWDSWLWVFLKESYLTIENYFYGFINEVLQSWKHNFIAVLYLDGASEVVALGKASEHTMSAFHQVVAFLFRVESHSQAAPKTPLAWIICCDLGLGQIQFLYIH